MEFVLFCETGERKMGVNGQLYPQRRRFLAATA
jgi:hypothetical protein